MVEFYKEFGELGYLANYSNHGFIKNGIFYKTVEHYYQSEKYSDENIKQKIINAETPKEASNIGRDRNNVRKENFKRIKNKVMFEGILEKFRQNRDIAYKLIETRNQKIVEATVDEYYWGIGKDRSGLNVIGNILERVREEIKREILNNIIKNCEGKDIYILGHRNPDADSIISSYILSRILNRLGVKAHFAVLSEEYDYCDSDKLLIGDFIREEPVVVDDTFDKHFILVDHNNLGGLLCENVIGAIDHHVITGEVFDTLEIEYASTCLFIYDLFKDIYDFNEYEKLLVGISVLADTDYLSSKRFSDEDKKILDSLNLKLDLSALKQKYFKKNDFNQSVYFNLMSNYKYYIINDLLIKRSIIYSNTDDYLEHFYKYVEYLKDEIDIWLLIWCDVDKKVTNVYYGGEIYHMDEMVTSTDLILKFINEQKKLL